MRSACREGCHGPARAAKLTMPSGGISGNQCIEKIQQSLRGAHRNGVDRLSDNVRMNMLGKVEANRKPARPGALRAGP